MFKKKSLCEGRIFSWKNERNSKQAMSNRKPLHIHHILNLVLPHCEPSNRSSNSTGNSMYISSNSFRLVVGYKVARAYNELGGLYYQKPSTTFSRLKATVKSKSKVINKLLPKGLLWTGFWQGQGLITPSLQEARIWMVPIVFAKSAVVKRHVYSSLLSHAITGILSCLFW